MDNFFFLRWSIKEKNTTSGKPFILSDEINSPELFHVLAALLNSAILWNRFQTIFYSNKKVSLLIALLIKPQLKTFSPSNRKINLSNNYLAYTIIGMGMRRHVYMCESFKVSGTSTRNQNTEFKK